MTFVRAKLGGWGFQDPLTSGQANQIDIDHTFALDGRDGGIYNSSAGIEFRNTWTLNGDSLPVVGTDTMLNVFGSTSYNSATPAVESVTVLGHSNLGGDAGDGISAVGGPSTVGNGGIGIASVGGATTAADKVGGIGLTVVGGDALNNDGGKGATIVGGDGDPVTGTGGEGATFAGGDAGTLGGRAFDALGGESTTGTGGDGGNVTAGDGIDGGVGLRVTGGDGTAATVDGEPGVAIVATAGERDATGGATIGATAIIATGGTIPANVNKPSGHGIETFGGAADGLNPAGGDAIQGTGGTGGPDGDGGAGGDFVGGPAIGGATPLRGPAIRLRTDTDTGAHILFDATSTLPNADEMQVGALYSYNHEQIYYASDSGTGRTWAPMVPLVQLLGRIGGGAGGGLNSISFAPDAQTLNISGADNPVDVFTARITFQTTIDSIDGSKYFPHVQYIQPQALGGAANTAMVAVVVTGMTDTYIDIQFADVITNTLIDLAAAGAGVSWGIALTIGSTPQQP